MDQWTGRFHGGTLTARRVRRAVREQLSGELPERRLEDVELLVSELATNSVRHAGCDESGEIVMEAAVDGDRVRVQVCDHGHGFADGVPEPTPPEQAGGFGLVLLDLEPHAEAAVALRAPAVGEAVERARHV
jgi:anti-sigma regulatory factor (Ser/Thr protein kinase)